MSLQEKCNLQFNQLDFPIMDSSLYPKIFYPVVLHPTPPATAPQSANINILKHMYVCT